MHIVFVSYLAIESRNQNYPMPTSAWNTPSSVDTMLQISFKMHSECIWCKSCTTPQLQLRSKCECLSSFFVGWRWVAIEKCNIASSSKLRLYTIRCAMWSVSEFRSEYSAGFAISSIHTLWTRSFFLDEIMYVCIYIYTFV